MDNKLILGIIAFIVIISGSIIYVNIDFNKTYYCDTKDIYRQCDSLSKDTMLRCYLSPNNLNKVYEQCGTSWKKVKVENLSSNIECEFDFDTNRGIINNLIYSLNTRQYKNEEMLNKDKSLLIDLSTCVLAQQNSTHYIIGLENIVSNLVNNNETNIPEKITFPELVILDK